MAANSRREMSSSRTPSRPPPYPAPIAMSAAQSMMATASSLALPTGYAGSRPARVDLFAAAITACATRSCGGERGEDGRGGGMVFTAERGGKKLGRADDINIQRQKKKPKKRNCQRRLFRHLRGSCRRMHATRRDATPHAAPRESSPAVGPRDGARLVLINSPSFFSSVSTRQE